MKKVLFSIFYAISLNANVAVSGDVDYNIIKSKNIDLIYSDEYQHFSKDVLDIQEGVIEDYSKTFGYMLDDKLYLGLLSSNNQVANAFSTQIPLNMQMDFGAGTLESDYFSATSWIKTLLYHESAHNFQLNPKKNRLSYYSHKIFKNSFYNGALFPIFPVPNLACSSFMLEGNAVLNESWHDNGGRLYNGSLLALVITQAKAGYITPSRTYNQHLYFPYSTHNYIVGGFFNLFLAQKYGLDQVNRYFYNFSGQWIPVFTNSVFKESFGVSYEDAIKEYSSWLNQKFKDFRVSSGKLVAKSKHRIKLTSTDDKIIFLTSDRKSAPTLVEFLKSSNTTTKKKVTLPWGRVFFLDGKFYSLTSGNISPSSISVGLFDENGNILESTKSKALQMIKDKKLIYFDIPSSFDEPMLYVDGEFYDKVNSSVFCDKDGNKYYFKQNSKTRVLYKNKKPIFSYSGWYGFVCDVDKDGGVYFIANSPYGSTLYRYKRGNIKRVLNGDDIVDAKLIDDDKVLIETITADGIEFKNTVLTIKDENIYEVKYFFEKNKNNDIKEKNIQITKVKKYKPLSNLHYSSLETTLTYNEESVDFSVTAKFTDALMQNSISLFSSKFDEDTIAGFAYDNSKYRLNFGFALYGMLDHDENISSREYGFNSYLEYPLYENLYTSVDTSLTYSISDERDDKEPLVWSISYVNAKHFGDSMYLNYGDFITASVGYDRDDLAAGIKYFRQRELGNETYLSLNLSAASSEVKNDETKRGIKIESYKNYLSNALNFEMPSLVNDIYVKSIVKAGVGIKKVFNLDKYFFSFPISLRREALYGKYNYYDLTFKDDFQKGYSEFIVGLKADLLYFNSLSLPFSVEYIYNDDLKESSDFRVLFDMSF